MSNAKRKTAGKDRLVTPIAAEFGKGVPIWDASDGYTWKFCFDYQPIANWYANCLTLPVLAT